MARIFAAIGVDSCSSCCDDYLPDYRIRFSIHNRVRYFVIVVGDVLAPFFTFGIPSIVGNLMLMQSIHSFNVDRHAFLADPKGFPMLRKFAQIEYGIEVVLGDAEDSWALTTVNLPNLGTVLMSGAISRNSASIQFKSILLPL